MGLNRDSLKEFHFTKILSPLTWSWTIIYCLLVALAYILIYQYNQQFWTEIVNLYSILTNRHQLKDIIYSFGPFSPLIYILIQVIQVVVAPIPGGAVEFLGGYLFGSKAGFLYSMIGSTLGSWLAFSLARIFKRLAVEKFVSLRVLRKFDYLNSHHGVTLSFLLFLMPGFPKDAFCYLLGLTPMRLGVFLIISTVGRIPGTLMASLQGGKAFDHQYVTVLFLLAICILVLSVFFIYEKAIHNWVKKWGGAKA